MEKKQLNARVEGIKTALNDPRFFELLRSEHVKIETGHRVVVNYTAKKKLGGPVLWDDICGFVWTTSVEFDKKDFVNRSRILARVTGRR